MKKLANAQALPTSPNAATGNGAANCDTLVLLWTQANAVTALQAHHKWFAV
jgi:hypothetical protein